LAVAEKAGILQALSRLLSPLIRRVFPSVAKSGEAQAAVTLNIAANMLGLGNAATPAGQRAMKELQKVSDDPNRASNDMVMLLVINNSSLTLVPTTVSRAACGGGKRKSGRDHSCCACGFACVDACSLCGGAVFAGQRRGSHKKGA